MGSNDEKLDTRAASVNDVSALSALVNSAYRGESSKAGWTTEAGLLGGQRTDPATLESTILEKESVILLFEEANHLIACVFLQKKPACAYLGMLTVKPELQGGGLGRRMLSLAENWIIANWASPSIEMTVIQKRLELIAWYERRGYVVTDRREAFPYGDERFGIPKVDDLEFVVLEKRL